MYKTCRNGSFLYEAALLKGGHDGQAHQQNIRAGNRYACNLIADYHQIINFVLDYVESNQYLIANAYNAIGQAGLKQFFCLDFIACIEALITQGVQKQGVTLEEDYKGFLCAFYTEAIAGCLLDYIISPPSRNREKMIGYLEHLLLRTLPAAIT